MLERWTHGERLLAALAAACLVVAIAGLPLARALSPEVAATAAQLRLGISPGESAHRYLAELVAWSRELGLALAATPLWLLAAPGSRRPRSARVVSELRRAAVLALVPAAVGAILATLVGYGAFPGLGRAVEAHTRDLLVPGWVALSLSLAGGAFLVTLAWRLTRPREPDPQD